MRIVANCHGIFLMTIANKQSETTEMEYIVYAAFAKHNHFVCCFIDSSGCINYAVKIEITQRLEWNELALNAKLAFFLFCFQCRNTTI